jgi:hypothetical protein
MRDLRVLLALVLVAGCAGDAPGAVVTDGGAPGAPDGASATSPDAATPAPELGTGDHSPGSVDLVVEVDGDDLHHPTGLAFDPQSGRLWIVNQDDNSWTLVDDVESPGRQVRRFADDSAHFFDRPSALSFHGSEPALATCQESLNHGDEFMGPTAWTSDLGLFTGDGGSHYDMLHESGNCVGIAWTEAHVWWAFNGRRGALDRNDFHGWHPDAPGGLGGEDHRDGEIFRYADGELARVAGVPAGMKHDAAARRLYVSDTGHGRVVAIDTTPRRGVEIDSLNQEVPLYRVDGVGLEEVVAPGELAQPSGLDLYHGAIYVADHARGVISAYATSGAKLNWLDTGLGAGHVTGVVVSPTGHVHFLDATDGKLYRIDPK